MTGTGLSAGANAVAVQADGRILVGGMFASYRGSANPCLLRVNTNGTYDGTFTQPGTGLGSGACQVYSILVQPDTKIVVAGQFNHYDATTLSGVARVNANGTMDGTWTG